MKSRSFKLFIPFLAALLLLTVLLVALHNRPARAKNDPLQNRRPQQPFNPFGTAKINGQSVTNGTPISAYCPGLTVTPTINAFIYGNPPEAWYDLEIPGDDPDTPADEGCTAGQTVFFEIDGQLAYQTAAWAAGVPAQIELTLAEPGPSLTLDKGLAGGGDSAMPYFLAGSTVTWAYTLTNTGDVSLFPVTVTDDNGTPADPGDDVDVCIVNRLVPDYPAVCEKAMTVTAGLVTAQATAVGLFGGNSFEDTAAATYYGATPAIALAKSTNGFDADSAPGPSILAGHTVTWTYVVSNTGNISLTNVTVSDDQLGLVCQPGTIKPGDPPFTCTVQGTAAGGQYANLGTTVGTPLGGLDLVSASDPSHYFGFGPQIDLEKTTNGLDADVGPGAIIQAGAPVSWTFTVSNTGNLDLTGVTISDDQLGPICSIGLLGVGSQPVICTADGLAAAGQHMNLGRVEATYNGNIIADEDPSHYFGAVPGLAFRVLTNGQEAAEAPGPTIMAGDSVTWTLSVTNTGNISLTNVTVSGEKQGVLCDFGLLAPAEPAACQVTGIAVAGQYSESMLAEAEVIVANTPFSSAGASHYFGAAPAIQLEKSTNGVDADDSSGPKIVVDSQITWRYEVTNKGNVTLSDVTVRDDNGTPGDLIDDFTVCTIAQLSPGQDHSCEVSGIAVEGLYGNLGTVTAMFEETSVDDSDPSHYEGITTWFVYLPTILR